MDDLGRWMRRVLDEVAPPVDPRGVVESVTRRGGRRWPIAVAAAAVVVLLVGGGYWLFSGEPNPGVADDTTTTSLETTTTTSLTEPVVLEVLEPRSISCSSELPDFPCSNLIDGDPATEWQAPNGGIGAVITIEFGEPVSVFALGFTNIPDDVRFRRNARIRGLAITADGTHLPATAELADVNDEAQSVGELDPAPIALVSTVRIALTSAYPAQSHGDLPPFTELALAELEVIGYPGVFPPEGPTTVTTVAVPVVPALDALLDELDRQATGYLERVDQIESDWEGRRATFAATQDALAAVANDTRDWVAIVTDRVTDDSIPATDAAPVVAGFAALPPAVDDIITALNSPDDGSLRLAAVAAFHQKIAVVRAAIAALRAGNPPVTVPTGCSASALNPDLPEIAGLPEAVAAMRAEIAAAAVACDIARLVELALQGAPFFYSIGGLGDPTEFWILAEAAGEQPLRLLVCLMEQPPALTPVLEDESVWYFWPTAIEVPWGDLTVAEKDALRSCIGEESYGWAEAYAEYLGPRLVITDSGDWSYFVLGGD